MEKKTSPIIEKSVDEKLITAYLTRETARFYSTIVAIGLMLFLASVSIIFSMAETYQFAKNTTELLEANMWLSFLIPGGAAFFLGYYVITQQMASEHDFKAEFNLMLEHEKKHYYEKSEDEKKKVIYEMAGYGQGVKQ